MGTFYFINGDILLYCSNQAWYDCDMPRTARASVGNLAYHVFNRGNGRATVFHDDDDFANFVRLIGEASERVAMRVVAYCVMPNHFHLVLWPRKDGDLGVYMQWLMTAHVRRHHHRHGTSGHVWQGRFKAFPIQKDDHLLTVLRYVERNPVRAGLVARSRDWRWSSRSAVPASGAPKPRGPLPLPPDWARLVDLEIEADLRHAPMVSDPLRFWNMEEVLVS